MPRALLMFCLTAAMALAFVLTGCNRPDSAAAAAKPEAAAPAAEGASAV